MKRRSWHGAAFPERETPALVAIVNRRKDWRLAQTERWYRIPVRSAPEYLMQIRYVAFYQTRVFANEKWSVNYYAAVRGLETLRRCELLPDEPNHDRANERYYRVRIGEVQRLAKPILSRRRRRIVFIPTTLERLLRAREINDLYCTSPIEDRLYDELKDAGLPTERQYLVRENEVGYMLDLALFCSEGRINIECDGAAYHSTREKAEQDRTRDNVLTAAGWRVLRFSGREISREPGECLKTIRKMVRRLDGAVPDA